VIVVEEEDSSWWNLDLVLLLSDQRTCLVVFLVAVEHRPLALVLQEVVIYALETWMAMMMRCAIDMGNERCGLRATSVLYLVWCRSALFWISFFYAKRAVIDGDCN